MPTSTKVGVYVDGNNIAMNGGWGMRYDVLREFAVRDGGHAVRLNAYLSYDTDRADRDDAYRRGQGSFHSSLRDMGFKVIRKDVRWYADETGRRYSKSNVDLDMAVDALLQSQHLDRVVMATGDGDFVRVVRALQNSGCRVEVLAFDNVSGELRREADMFLSGYLVPNLQPTTGARDLPPWGEIGSRVRGVCYNHTGKGYGFLRFIRRLSDDLWITDSRHPGSPYESVFFHDSMLPPEVSYLQLPSRDLIFEFEVREAPQGSGKSGLQAGDLALIQRAPRYGQVAYADTRTGPATSSEGVVREPGEAAEGAAEPADETPPMD